MKYTELRGNLFSVPKDFVLAHCIDETAAMGAGIAKQFAEKYPSMHEKLKQSELRSGNCILFEHGDKHDVANLVTKPHYSMNAQENKLPSLNSIETCLRALKLQAIYLDQYKIALPLIGCGLDRMKWWAVRKRIKKVLQYSRQFEVIVCYLEKDKYKLRRQ